MNACNVLDVFGTFSGDRQNNFDETFCHFWDGSCETFIQCFKWPVFALLFFAIKHSTLSGRFYKSICS